MTNLLISYVCNNGEGNFMFGDIFRNFDEMPTVTEIKEIVILNYPNNESVAILNIVKFSDEDFEALNKDIPYER